MGKPRRCSNNFFAEERAELAKKRTKIRMLQQRKQGDVANFKDLPEDIPLQLTIGTRVTARYVQAKPDRWKPIQRGKHLLAFSLQFFV